MDVSRGTELIVLLLLQLILRDLKVIFRHKSQRLLDTDKGDKIPFIIN